MDLRNESGSGSWKRVSAILLVAVMVVMVAMPMVSVAEPTTPTTTGVPQSQDLPVRSNNFPDYMLDKRLSDSTFEPVDPSTAWSDMMDRKVTQAPPAGGYYTTGVLPPAPVPDAVAYFTDRAVFDAFFPGLPMEDFEESLGDQVCDPPLDENSNSGGFVPGDILPGIQFTDGPVPTPGDGLYVLPAGGFGNPSVNIVANYFVKDFEIHFTTDTVNAVGMDLVSYYAGVPLDIEIYGGPTDSLLATTTAPASNAGTFWGVYSDDTYITRIIIRDPTGANAEGVDNIAFGPVLPYNVVFGPEFQGKVGDPGDVIEYSLHIMNVGTEPDTYTFDIDGNSWPTSLMLSGSTMTNPSFETGDFTGWSPTDLMFPYVPLMVAGAGNTCPDMLDGFLTAPTDGSMSVQTGFDGAGPGHILLGQDITVPPSGGTLLFDYRACWDLVNFAPPGVLDRTFSVHVEPAGGGMPFQSTLFLTAPGGTYEADTGILEGTLSLNLYAGSTVYIEFDWWVPESFTGPAYFELDNLRLISPGSGNSIYLNPGEAATVLARVEVPGSAGPGDQDLARITARSQGDPGVSSAAMLLSQARAPYLLVDDDGGLSTEDYFLQAFNDIGYPVNYWTTDWGTPTVDFMGDYSAVIWMTGNQNGGVLSGSPMDTLSVDEQAAIGDFLDAGGRMYMSSGGLGWDGAFNGWAGWINWYFGASAWNGWFDSPDISVNGIWGDPIGHDFDLNVHPGAGDSSPELMGFTTVNDPVGSSALSMVWFGISGSGGLIRSTNAGRTAYTAFDLADVDGQATRAELLYRILNWLDNPIDFQAAPDIQTGIGWVGDYVDHTVTITNTGDVPDTYKLYCRRGMFTWPTEIWDADNTREISHSEVVPPGGTWEFNVRVRIPRVNMGDWDLATVAIESTQFPGPGQWIQTVDVFTRTSLPAPFYDNFESGVFGQGPYTTEDWTRDVPDDSLGIAGVNTMTSHSPTHSMFTAQEPVTITSAPIYMTNVQNPIVSYWIQRGSGAFSEKPDSDEDLVVEYYNSHHRWVELDRFPGGGTPGEVFNVAHPLPPEANCPDFKLRFRQLDGSGFGFDYWHIDDVYIGGAQSAMDLGTLDDSKLGGMGQIVTYELFIDNFAPHNDIFDITLAGNSWPAWSSAAQVPVPAGGTGTFNVFVQIPADAGYGSTDTVWVTATSALDPTVWDTQQLITGVGVVQNTDQNTWYMTIQDAVDDANPGEHLLAYPQIYNENVLVNKPLTISGFDRDTTIVDGGEAGSVFHVTANDVTIQDLTIQNSVKCEGQAGVLLDGVSGCSVSNNIITGNAEGIIVNQNGGNTIEGNVIRDQRGPVLTYIETTFASNNGQDGNMFDVTAWRDLFIMGFDCNIDPGTTTVEFWYKTGTYVGSETNPGAWTLFGSATVTSTASDTPTWVPISGLALSAGQTYGFYLTTTGTGPDFNYRNGANTYDDGNIRIQTGVGKSYPFGSTYTPRTWNGRIYYAVPGAADATGIHVIGPADFSHQDDFSVDTGRWIYYGSASRTGGYCQLTPALNGRVGRILYDTPVHSAFTVEFDFLAGGGSGADGLAFNFFKEDYVPVGGGSLGSVDADGTALGYSLEFDNYLNGGGDPSARHIAITHDTTHNHLVYVNDNRVEDNAWHHVKMMVDGDSIAVYVDDMTLPLLFWSGVVDMTYGGMSFSAGTGGLNNNHWVDNIQITPMGNGIWDNVVRDNDRGIVLEGTLNNRIYHNDIINNGIQAIDDSVDGNTWHHGYPTGGNYWSDYTGPDAFSGPLQNIPGSDGIGDTAYMIDANSMDQYPLMREWTTSSAPPVESSGASEDPGATETPEDGSGMQQPAGDSASIPLSVPTEPVEEPATHTAPEQAAPGPEPDVSMPEAEPAPDIPAGDVAPASPDTSTADIADTGSTPGIAMPAWSPLAILSMFAVAGAFAYRRKR